MSLLTTGPDTVQLRPAVRAQDSDGNDVWQQGDTAYTWPGVSVQQGTENVALIEGQRVDIDLRVLGKQLPDNVELRALIYGRVFYLDREYMVIGYKDYHRGRITPHIELRIAVTD